MSDTQGRVLLVLPASCCISDQVTGIREFERVFLFNI